jgi:hypothetical protein
MSRDVFRIFSDSPGHSRRDKRDRHQREEDADCLDALHEIAEE